MFTSYELPLIAFVTASGFVLNSPTQSEVVPVYHIEQTMVSDDKVIKEIDETNYFSSKYSEVTSDGEFVKIDNANTEIQYQIKNGTNNIIVSITVEPEGKLKVYNYLSGNFYDLNVAAFKDVPKGEVEAKYQEIVDEISEVVLTDTSYLTGERRNSIKKLLEQEKSTVITTFVEYIESGQVEVLESKNSHDSRKALFEFLTVLVYVFVNAIIGLFDGFKITKVVYTSNPELELENRTSTLIPFKTALEQKDAYLCAERERRGAIQDFAYDNLEGEVKKKFLS